jgi:hypothetical protein
MECCFEGCDTKDRDKIAIRNRKIKWPITAAAIPPNMAFSVEGAKDDHHTSCRRCYDKVSNWRNKQREQLREQSMPLTRAQGGLGLLTDITNRRTSRQSEVEKLAKSLNMPKDEIVAKRTATTTTTTAIPTTTTSVRPRIIKEEQGEQEEQEEQEQEEEEHDDMQDGVEKDIEEEEDVEQPQRHPQRPPPQPREEEEEEAAPQESGSLSHAEKLRDYHRLKRGASDTDKTAAVREGLKKMNALAGHGISLSAFSQNASEDDKLEWLRCLRQKTEELVDAKSDLAHVRAAMEKLEEEGMVDAVSLLCRAVLIGRADLNGHAWLRITTALTNMATANDNGNRYDDDILKASIVAASAHSGRGAMEQLFGNGNAYDIPTAKHAKQVAKGRHADPGWNMGFSRLMVQEFLRRAIAWREKRHLYDGGSAGEASGCPVDATFGSDATDIRPMMRVDPNSLRLIGPPSFGNVGDEIGRIDDVKPIQASLQLHGGRLKAAINDDEEMSRSDLLELLNFMVAKTDVLVTQLATEEAALSNLREKFKARNTRAGNAAAAHGRQKTEISKQRVKRDELKHALESAADAVAVLRKATSTVTGVGGYTLDCVDQEDLLDALKAMCIQLTASAAHYLVGYLFTHDNRVKVPVLRLLYGSSLKYTSKADGQEVGSCEAMNKIINLVMKLVPDATNGRVRVTDVVTDGEFRGRRLKPGILAAEAPVEAVLAGSGQNKADKAQKVAQLCSLTLQHFPGLSCVPPLNIAGVFRPPLKLPPPPPPPPPTTTTGAGAGAAACDTAVEPGRSLIGMTVVKRFDGLCFAGEVTEYDKSADLYLVEFEDGDKEELNEGEIQDAIATSAPHSSLHSTVWHHLREEQALKGPCPRPKGDSDFIDWARQHKENGGPDQTTDATDDEIHAAQQQAARRAQMKRRRMCSALTPSHSYPLSTANPLPFHVDFDAEEERTPAGAPATSFYGTDAHTIDIGSSLASWSSTLNRLIPRQLQRPLPFFSCIPRTRRFPLKVSKQPDALAAATDADLEYDGDRDRLPLHLRSQPLSALLQEKASTLRMWHDSAAGFRQGEEWKLKGEKWKIKPLTIHTQEELKLLCDERKLSNKKNPYPPSMNSDDSLGAVLVERLRLDVEEKDAQCFSNLRSTFTVQIPRQRPELPIITPRLIVHVMNFLLPDFNSKFLRMVTLDYALDLYPSTWTPPPVSIAVLKDIAVDAVFGKNMTESPKEGLFYGPPAKEPRDFTDVSSAFSFFLSLFPSFFLRLRLRLRLQCPIS